MKKKKIIVCVCTCLCLALIGVALSIIFKGEDTPESKGGNKQEIENQGSKAENDKVTLTQVEKIFQEGIQELKDGKYSNLLYNDFEASVEGVEGLYNIEIQRDLSYENRTFIENFEIMDTAIDKFFMEDIDKSFLVMEFGDVDGNSIDIAYDDIEKECVDEKYNELRTGFLWGETENCFIQITESLDHAWFSRRAFGSTQPGGGNDNKKVYPYISCVRQNDDANINLMDGQIKLSEMEERVLNYLNNNFPIPVSENITLGIGDAQIVENGQYEGVAFRLRRIYKGVPFEYGSSGGSGMYIDSVYHDAETIFYANSAYPDSLSFIWGMSGIVAENETISDIIPLSDALSILSEAIGENSIYDVYGVELVYRNIEISEEQSDTLYGMLVPKWKIVTINQNDDKYTLFYIDVVTGEITERFEYYYE